MQLSRYYFFGHHMLPPESARSKRPKFARPVECPVTTCRAYKPTKEHVEDCLAKQAAARAAELEERRRVSDAAHARLAALVQANEVHAGSHAGHSHAGGGSGSHQPGPFTWRPREKSFTIQLPPIASTTIHAAHDRLVNHVLATAATPDPMVGVGIAARSPLSPAAAVSFNSGADMFVDESVFGANVSAV